MKQLILITLFIPFMLSAQNRVEICNCADIMLSMFKENMFSDGSKESFDKIQEKYHPEIEKCNALDYGLSEEAKAKSNEILLNCPSYKKVMQDMEKLKNPTPCICAEYFFESANEVYKLKDDNAKALELTFKYANFLKKCSDKLIEQKTETEKENIQKAMKKCPDFIEAMKIYEKMDP